MFFRRKGWLRKEYDERLLQELVTLKKDWLAKKALIERCVDPSLELTLEAKMAEVKYFSLFKEAKVRQVKVKH
ncbi:YaaL family protein [Bacillus sp. AGMB 02131]|uniref:YaaL family protein n=1 Tax=Peribacillus faecalis TaxID=2772559 RepID=A0A927CYG8_9BACI|nr:YaaL family protein [Peribacillus faecalis]MBD3110042.1 YaaL family protein [Peribacillus faecalis]